MNRPSFLIRPSNAEVFSSIPNLPESAPSFQLSSGSLSLVWPDKRICLRDKIFNHEVGCDHGSAFNIAVEAVIGEFPLFDDRLSELSFSPKGDFYQSVRVTTPIPALGATALTELFLWNAQPVVSVLTWFEAEKTVPFRDLELLSVEGKSAVFLSDGSSWKPCEAGECTARKLSGAWDDLRRYDAAHPFLSHLSFDEESLIPVLDPGCTAAPEGKRLALTSGDLVAELTLVSGGLLLTGLQDSAAQKELFSGDSSPMFRVLVKSAESGQTVYVDSASGWEISCIKGQNTETFVFEDVCGKEADGLEVVLTAILSPESSRISWKTDVRCHSDRLSIVRVDPPAMAIRTQAGMRSFLPLGSGVDLDSAPSHLFRLICAYPTIIADLQYMAFWLPDAGRGLYYGVHDPLGCPKWLAMEQHNGICRAETYISARGIGEAGNGCHLDGQVVWQLFDGDWYDATLIYRAFARNCTVWGGGVHSVDRKDIPDWFLKLPLCLNSAVQEGAPWLEELLEATEDIGVPTMAHMYTWHQIPFDKNYPHYKPAKDEYLKKLPTIKAHGIKVMPYINGRLWDTHDEGDEDRYFTALAKPHATIGTLGRVITEHYASTNAKGEPVQLAVMCPSEAMWQEKITGITEWILKDLGSDAVYIDQIAAANPVNCLSTRHAHRPGGGSWWYECYRNMLEHVRLHAPADTAITTEASGEPYVGSVAGFLTWNWSGDRGMWCWVGDINVPAYPVVYSDLQPTFGRLYNLTPDMTVSFRLLTAQALCYGNVIGWCSPKMYLTSSYRNFFRDVARARWQYGEYFYDGRCLRPPKLEGDIPILQDANMKTPAVMSALWQRNRDGKRLMLLVNLSDEPVCLSACPEGLPSVTLTLEPLCIYAQEEGAE